MKRLVIFGAGQQGRNCKRLAPLCGYEVVAFVDHIVVGEVEGVPVYSNAAKIPDFKDCYYIVAVGDLKVRKFFICVIEKYDLKCANLIDPTADIEEGAVIGVGNYIYKFASVYGSATIGNHNIINCKAVIATDAVIGDNCDICMGANICGDVHVGDNSYVGYNATVVSGYNVGRDACVKPGAVVYSDVEDGAVVGGVPAQHI